MYLNCAYYVRYIVYIRVGMSVCFSVLKGQCKRSLEPSYTAAFRAQSILGIYD